MSATPIVLLCPGQGAQAVSMAKAWHDASPKAKAILDEADRIFASESGSLDIDGRTLSDIAFNGPQATLNRTDLSQPALYAAGIACYHALPDEIRSCPLRAVAGLSLGEYTALHLAGAFSFEDGLRLVMRRGQLMQQAAEASMGGMVALIGADEAQANEVCARAAGDGILVPANFNAPGQIVLSGAIDACDRAVAVAGEVGVHCSSRARKRFEGGRRRAQDAVQALRLLRLHSRCKLCSRPPLDPAAVARHYQEFIRN